MRSIEASFEGTGFRVAIRDGPAPVPKADEVLVRVAGSGLNRADLLQIAGRYPPPPGEPEILGLEISGTVVDSGEKVCALLAGGGHAEIAAVPPGQIFPAPKAMNLVSASGIPEAFITAFLNLAVEGGLARGGRALVHAGASGVGLAAIQTAKYLGASVAATTRSAGKIEAIRRAGADLAIDTTAGGFEEEIERAWGKDSVDVVLDPVGADTFAGNLRLAATGARVIFLAAMSGAGTQLDIALLMKKRARLIGSTLRSRSRAAKAETVSRFRAEILAGFDSGALRVVVDSVFPPERAAEALARMKENRNTGKILIDWTSPPSASSPRA